MAKRQIEKVTIDGAIYFVVSGHLHASREEAAAKIQKLEEGDRLLRKLNEHLRALGIDPDED